MQMKKYLKSAKGSMTVYVAVTIFSFIIILSGLLAMSSSIRKSQLRTIIEIKKVYEKDNNRAKEIYNSMTLPTTIEDAISYGNIIRETVKVIDEKENQITIPKGFKVANEGKTVQDGIVIEDENGNQFVWVPIGTVTKNDGSKSNEIVLGRYTFEDTSKNGEPTLVQPAYTEANPTNYVIDTTDEDETNDFIITDYNKELSTYRPGVEASKPDGLNEPAKDLYGFVNSVKLNGGYYIARYEASYGSGYDSTLADPYENAKPLSKISTATSFDSSISGSLWNNVTQINAAKVCRNMYISANNVGVESDLVNSYMWDTAIVYIQEMTGEDYANKKATDLENTQIRNTGTTKVASETLDVKCNIYDMAANLKEWTTEYSSPCTIRGSLYNTTNNFTALRDNNYDATSKSENFTFRVGLYVK